MPRTRVVLLITLSFSHMECRRSGPTNGDANHDVAADSSIPGDGSPWLQALDRLAGAAHQTLYSLAFYGAGSQDVFIRTLVAEGQIADSCEELKRRLSGSGDEGFWALQIEVSAPQPGEYSIGADFRVPSATPTGKAFLQRVEGGREVERHQARAGAVTIITSPLTVEEFLTDQPFRMRTTLEFPIAASRQLECSGGAAAEDAAGGLQCRCQSADGSEFTCVPTRPSEDCCMVGAMGIRTVTTEARGIRCPTLCAAISPQLLSRCRALAGAP